jgi:hypothetical protein
MPEPRDYIDTTYLKMLADLLKQDKQSSMSDAAQEPTRFLWRRS